MPSDDSLARYRDKRSADRTPEPFGGLAATGAGIFVVQKHAASRTHYDLRLELDGVLKSWAVPKGISPDPADKKLAVHVEDHPVEYVEFEGIIPDGEYGAGEMIVWDIGRWVPLEDPVRGLESGKLLFELRGHKLRGIWTLVKLKKSDTGQDWLLIRERRGGQPILPDGSLGETSVLSGLTVEQLAERAAGWDPAEDVILALASAGVRKRRVDPEAVKFMLAKSADEPFDDPEWLFELKLDGYRMLAAAVDGEARLLTRNGNDATPSFPDVARSLRKLPYDRLVLDGEVVVLDDRGFPSFQRLQKRARLSRPLDVHRASVESPACFFAFDLLGVDGYDLRGLPLLERRSFLQEVIPPAGPIRLSEHFVGEGEALFGRVQEMGLEGIMAKRADSPYRGERSSRWLKIHAARYGAFAIIGFTKPKGSRIGFGALHLGVYEPLDPEDPEGAAELRYAGRVGTGFDDARLLELRERLDSNIRETSPVAGPGPKGAEHVWVEPELVAWVRYKEWTEEPLLRQPVFERLEDMPARECLRDAVAGAPGTLAEPVLVENRPPPVEALTLSNRDKVFWPREDDAGPYTKGDLIAYYRTIAPWLTPYLRDRPLVLTRYPDGIYGKSFFQKNAPGYAPDWIRTETIYSEGSARDIDYFVAGDATTLVYLANLGTIPLHVWASRMGSLEEPDWCTLDLDAKYKTRKGEEVVAPFEDVVTVARAIYDLCEDLELPSYVKTSGSTGIHVLIPLGGQLDYTQSRSLGQLIATVLAAELPDLATTARQPMKRDGRIYVDWVQNGHGRLIVAPYSVRPRPGAPVSAPLHWSEVKKGLRIEKFTIKSMPRRVRALKEDPFLGVLEAAPDLLGALQKLQTRMT